MAPTSRATHTLQWVEESAATGQPGANHQDHPQCRCGAATRPTEDGVASNRVSAKRGEYVPGPCTHRPSRHGSREHLKSVGRPQGGSGRGWAWRLGRSRNKVTVPEGAVGSPPFWSASFTQSHDRVPQGTLLADERRWWTSRPTTRQQHGVREDRTGSLITRQRGRATGLTESALYQLSVSLTR